MALSSDSGPRMALDAMDKAFTLLADVRGSLTRILANQTELNEMQKGMIADGNASVVDCLRKANQLIEGD